MPVLSHRNLAVRLVSSDIELISKLSGSTTTWKPRALRGRPRSALFFSVAERVTVLPFFVHCGSLVLIFKLRTIREQIATGSFLVAKARIDAARDPELFHAEM